MVAGATGIEIAIGAVFVLFVLLPALAFGYLLSRAVRLPDRLSVLLEPYGVTRWTALPPTLLLLAGFAWLSLNDALPGEDPPMADTLLFGLALFGAAAVAVGLGNLKRYRELQRGGTVGGPAQPVTADSVASSPLGGETTLGWEVRVREQPRFFTRGSWPRVHRESGGVVALVRGSTEQRRVNLEDARLDLRQSLYADGAQSWHVHPDEDSEPLPERVLTFQRDRGLQTSNQPRVYEEVTVAPGDPLTVMRPDSRSPTVVRGGFEAVLARTRRRVRAGVAGTIGLLAGFLGLGVRGGALTL